MKTLRALAVLLLALCSSTAFAVTLTTFGSSSFSVDTDITDISSYSQTSSSLTGNGTDLGSNVTGNFTSPFTLSNATSTILYLNLSVSGTNPESAFHFDLYNSSRDNYYRYTGNTINATSTNANFALTYDGLYNLSDGLGTAFTSISAASLTLDGGGSSIDFTLNNLSDGSSTEAAPIVTSTTVGGTVGSVLSASINATNTPTGYASGTLPSGLTLNTSSGVISGTPTAAGIVSVTVTATNGGGNGTGTITFNIGKASQSITGVAPTITKAVGAAAYTLNATSSGNLTLSYLSSNTGVATVAANGTVSVLGAGTTTLTVSQAGDSNYNAAANVIQVLTVTDAAPVVTSATVSGTVGSALSASINATNAPTGYISGSLPSGLTLNTSS
jgi:hypothetical protein